MKHFLKINPSAHFVLASVIALALVIPFLKLTPFLLFLLLIIFFISSVMFVDIFHGLILLLLIRPILDIATHHELFSLGPFSINLAAVLGILTILYAIVAVIKYREKIKSLPLVWQWLLFLGIGLVSMLYTTNISLSISEWIRIATIFSLFVIGFLATSTGKESAQIAKAIILSAFTPAIVAIYQFLTHNGFMLSFEDVPNRVFGTFAHPNPFAYFLTFALALLLFFILKKGNNHKILAVLYFIALTILLALTFTRGAWLVLIGTILFIGIFRFRKFLAISAFVLLTMYLTVEPIQARLDSLLLHGPSSSIQWRLALWEDSLSYAMERPIQGFGIGTAEEIILQKRGSEFGSTVPHNDYLRLAIDIGLIGVASYFILIISLLLLWIKKLKRYFASVSDQGILLLIFASFTIVIFAASTVDNILDATSLQWAYWAMAGGLLGILNNQTRLCPRAQ